MLKEKNKWQSLRWNNVYMIFVELLSDGAEAPTALTLKKLEESVST